MKSLKKLNQLLFIALCVICLPITIVHAAGGGGSGDLSQAQTIDPVVEYKKGVKYLQAEKYRKAEKAFRKVLKVDRKNPATNYALGLAYLGQDKFKKAVKGFSKALKYDPEMIEAMGRLGYAYNKLGESALAAEQKQLLLDKQTACGECDKATAIAEAITIIDGSSANLYDLNDLLNTGAADLAYINAVGLINRGDYSQALSLLATAAKAFGPHPDILTYQGFANRKMGLSAKAYIFYQAALTVDPNHRGANEYLGEFFVETGDLPAAKDQLAKLNDICQFGCEEAEELNRWIIAAES